MIKVIALNSCFLLRGALAAALIFSHFPFRLDAAPAQPSTPVIEIVPPGQHVLAAIA